MRKSTVTELSEHSVQLLDSGLPSEPGVALFVADGASCCLGSLVEAWSMLGQPEGLAVGLPKIDGPRIVLEERRRGLESGCCTLAKKVAENRRSTRHLAVNNTTVTSYAYTNREPPPTKKQAPCNHTPP